MNIRIAMLAAGLLLVARAGLAETFCVATADELTAALAAVQQGSAPSDEVRIRSGRYTAPDGGWHVDIQHRGIVIDGGFEDENCQTLSHDASLTVLDGHDAVRPLTIDTSFHDITQTNGQILISGLTFENGSGDLVGGLKISDSGPIYNGAIRVERNIFRNNVSVGFQEDNSAGALLAATDGSTADGQTFLIVRGNLFVDNRATEGAAAMLFSNNTIAVNNNTFVGNQSTDASADPRTSVTAFTSTGIQFNSNVFWANNPDNRDNTYDIRGNNTLGGGVAAKLFNNDLQTVVGTPAVDQANKSVDPGFLDGANGDFHLGSTSLVIDAGLDLPATGGIGSIDLDGSMRIQGEHVDMGAYETDPDFIFRNGFG